LILVSYDNPQRLEQLRMVFEGDAGDGIGGV
jgi:hypothetical protein